MRWHEHLGRGAPNYGLVMASVNKCLSENYITEPPVSPVEISRNNGTRVLFADFPENENVISGFLDFSNNIIYVNKTEPARRQTFTIAHELGHALLHRELFTNFPDDYIVLFRGPLGSSKDPLEQEANAFAANLLVPKTMLSKYIRIGNTAELSRLFNVSEDVIRYRMTFENKYASA